MSLLVFYVDIFVDEIKGLTTEQVRTDVELKLRMAGIKMIEEETLSEAGHLKDGAYLVVRVLSVIDSTETFYIY